MKILVAYATRHGATQGIAERIAQTLEADGLDVTLGPVKVRGLRKADAEINWSTRHEGAR